LLPFGIEEFNILARFKGLLVKYSLFLGLFPTNSLGAFKRLHSFGFGLINFLLGFWALLI